MEQDRFERALAALVRALDLDGLQEDALVELLDAHRDLRAVEETRR